MEPEVIAGEALGYRVRARLSVRASRSGPRVGIFQEGTHRLVGIPECVVHHPLVNRVARALIECMKASGTSAYDETANRGSIRALQVVVERSSGSAQVTLVQRGEHFDEGVALCDRLSRELGTELHSLFQNAQPQQTNTILGPRWNHVSGPPATCERIGGARVFYPPGAFGQANLDLFDRIVEQLHGEVPEGTNVLEFHAGAGAIGLGLVARSHSYCFNEVSADSLAGLELGLGDLPEVDARKVSVLRGPAANFGALADSADIVIVDPPRKGLEPGLLSALCSARGPRRLLYLSCDLASLARDAEALNRHFVATRVTGFALFPFTKHVETLVRFER